MENTSVIGRLAFLASIVGDQAVAGIQNMAKGTGAAMTKLASAVPAAAFAASAAALAGMGAALAGSIVAAAQFEDSFALVRKVLARASDEELADIRESILDLSNIIPVTADQLARLASVAGQLGVGVRDIPKFVEVVAKLGVATNMTAEQAAFSMARLAAVTGVGTDNVEQLANVLVRLGNNTAATESEIVLLATRFGAAGQIAGLSADEILAFSASVRATGNEAQAGATALQKFFLTLQTAIASGGPILKSFADTAGMTTEEFRRIAKEDISEAAVAFIEGLSNIGEEGGNVTKILNEVGLGSVRVAKVLLSVSTDVDELKSNLALANDEMEKQNALNVEAEKRFGTLLNQIQRLRNVIKSVAIDIGDDFVPVIARMVGNIADAISGLREFSDVLETESFVKATKALAGFTTLALLPLVYRIPQVKVLVQGLNIAFLHLRGTAVMTAQGVAMLTTALKPFLIAGAVIAGFTVLANKVAKTAEELAIAKRNLEDFRDVMEGIDWFGGEDVDKEIAKALFGSLEESTQEAFERAFGRDAVKVIQDILSNDALGLSAGIESIISTTMGNLAGLIGTGYLGTDEAIDALGAQLPFMEEQLAIAREEFGEKSKITQALRNIVSLTKMRVESGRALTQTQLASLYVSLDELDVINEVLKLQTSVKKETKEAIDAELTRLLRSNQYRGNIQDILNDEEERLRTIKQFLPYSEDLRDLVGDIKDDTEDATESMGEFAELIQQANDFATELDAALKPLEAFQDLEEAKEDLRDAKEEIISLDKEELETNEELVRVREELQRLQKSGKYLQEDALEIEKEMLELEEMRKAVNHELELSAQDQLKIKKLERELKQLETAAAQGSLSDAQLQIDAIKEQIDAIKTRGVTSADVTEKEAEINEKKADAEIRLQDEINDLLEDQDLLSQNLLDIDEKRKDAADKIVDANIEIAKKTTEAIIAYAQLDKDGRVFLNSLAQSIGIPLNVMTTLNKEIDNAISGLKVVAGFTPSAFSPTDTDWQEVGKRLSGNFSRRAGGGMVRMGNSAIVGERGMELIRPNANGVMVRPLGEQYSSGGGGNVVNLNITGLPTDPIAARKIAQNIQRELNKLKGDGRSGIIR